MTTVIKNSEQLIDQCQGLVRSLALRLQKSLPRNLELDDLIAYGQVGLAEAARDFDATRGGQFTTFAYYRIRGAIYDGVSKMSWVSRAHYNRIKYQQAADDLLRLQSEGETPPPTDVNAGLDWLKNVTGALAIVYLSTKGASGEASESLEVEDRQCPSPSAAIVESETNVKLHELIDSLPPEPRELIRATYFEGLTLTEAGKRLGIGKAWASRLHARTLERLARSLRQSGLES